MYTTRPLISFAASLVLVLAACSPEQSATHNSEPVASDVAETTDTTEPKPPTDPETADSEREPEPEPAPEEPTAAEVGDTLEISQWDESLGAITVAGVETSSRPYDDFGDGPKNGVFVIFTVAVEADAPVDVYDGDFYVLTDDGTRYDIDDGNSFDAVDYDETLGWVELNAGEKKSGLLAFDVPTEHGRLAYTPNYDGGPIGIWVF